MNSASKGRRGKRGETCRSVGFGAHGGFRFTLPTLRLSIKFIWLIYE
jgi:hypothetical protein